jgi:chaperone BCS1
MVSRISLSALLNVIDSVASQGGRILIMTTIHSESLDDALIRPYRVGMRINLNLRHLQ